MKSAFIFISLMSISLAACSSEISGSYKAKRMSGVELAVSDKTITTSAHGISINGEYTIKDESNGTYRAEVIIGGKEKYDLTIVKTDNGINITGIPAFNGEWVKK